MQPQYAYRKTSQPLMPAGRESLAPGQYDIYPAYPLAGGRIEAGFDALAERMLSDPRGAAVVDGYPGVLWNDFRSRLEAALLAREPAAKVVWQDAAQALLPPEKIDALIAPYLGGGDPLFGFRFPGALGDFFDPARLAALRPDPAARLNILYGVGAALAGWDGPLFYLDVPKNEIQFRFRSQSIRCLGAREPLDPKTAYKRSYFIDWVAANRHKAALLPRIDWVIDAQRPDLPTFTAGGALSETLSRMARTYFRVRPWFEPGPWGGQWIKNRIPGVAQDVPNYAWSFELIVPENGLIFESDGLLLEVSFDTLMFQEYEAVLGECAPEFRWEFPIRYDFLDTVDGGNLSIQCHPRPEYIRRNFGETFTQDECYYLLDCVPGARVYIGFQEGIDPEAFKADLLRSAATAEPVEIDRYVYSRPVQKHDLLLIPNGTIHGAGRGCLVLEISATPYIFTFKMYDWLRLDLNGEPRSLNIERAFDNLYFDRQGARIEREFVSHPQVTASGRAEGGSWQVVHLPTHPQHFYDVERLEFTGWIDCDTGGRSCHVMSLVEGRSLILETESGARARFNYAETFVIPAAAGRYRLTSENGEAGEKSLKVVRTFVKPRSQRQGLAPGSLRRGIAPEVQPDAA